MFTKIAGEKNKYKHYHEIIQSKQKWQLFTWQLFHWTAYLYPDNPTEEEKIKILNFYQREFYKYIACKTCAFHYLEICDIKKEDVKNTSTLLNWTQKLHNIVNARLSKPEFRENIEEWFQMGFFNLPDNETQLLFMKEFMNDTKQVQEYKRIYQSSESSVIEENSSSVKIRHLFQYMTPAIFIFIIIYFIYKRRRHKSK